MIARISRARMGAVAALTAGVLAAVFVPATAQAADSITTVVGGLDNPRGLTFAPDGSLYVAEAGRGGKEVCFQGPEGDSCYGTSGAITEVGKPGRKRQVLTGLPSIASPEGGNALGPTDVAFGLPFVFNFTVGLGGNTELREKTLPASGKVTGTVQRSDIFSKHLKQISDLAQYEQTANPDGVNPPDSNPTSLVTTNWGGTTVAVDAGGNSLVKSAGGKLSTLAVFPSQQVEAPPFLGLPAGTKVPVQAVPTSVVRGPDGAYYVGQLTGFPFTTGIAKVYRVVPGQEPTVYADGFTHIVDLAFDRNGSLYVLEIAHNGLLSKDPNGALIKVDKKGGPHTTVVGTGLTMPGGLAIKDGDAYISNFSTFAGKGEILRVKLR
jgi:hypothetical protein